MRKTILGLASCLLLPAALLAQQADPAPGTVGSNTTLTLGGKVDLHTLGKPTLTTPDGVVYQLVGDQASTIQQLKKIDDKVIVVAGQILKDGEKPTLNLSVISFWVVGSSSTVGAMPAGTKGAAAKVTPVITLFGSLGTKLVGKPDLTTAEGKTYKLIGPQVATLEELKGLNKGLLEINGQLIDNDGRLDVVVLSFRLLGPQGGIDGKGAIGTPMLSPDGSVSAMEPSVTIEGVLTTNLVSQPDLRTKEGKTYRLIGPEVSIIGVTKGIDGKNVTATGQVIANGKFENLVVSTFVVQEPQPVAPAVQPAPTAPATEAPPVAAPADPQAAPAGTPKL